MLENKKDMKYQNFGDTNYNENAHNSLEKPKINQNTETCGVLLLLKLQLVHNTGVVEYTDGISAESQDSSQRVSRI